MKLADHPEKDVLNLEWDQDKNTASFFSVGTGYGKVWWNCSKGHSYEMAVHNKIKGRGCPRCNRPGLYPSIPVSQQYPQLKAMFSVKNKRSLESVGIDYRPSILWCCKKEHEWKRSLSAQLAKMTCPFCSGERHLSGFNSIAQTHPEALLEWAVENELDPASVSAKSNVSAKWVCKECSHHFTSKISRRVFQETICPACAGNILVPGKTDLISLAPQFVADYDELSTGRPASQVGRSHTVYWFCKEGHSYKTTLEARLRGFGFCSTCRPNLGSSEPERQVLAYVKELLPSYEVKHRVRSVITPYELDVYVPELGKAIEVNGDYWHSDEYRIPHGLTPAAEYHAMKTDLCNAQNIELLYVWVSGWRSESEATRATIRRHLGVSKFDRWMNV